MEDGDEKPSSILFSELVYGWLNNALDCGITEETFWNMTIAEYSRAIESRNRTYTLQLQEKASFDYILADLIGRSVGRLQSSSIHMPTIETAYPSIYDTEEMREQREKLRMEQSAMRFMKFAALYENKKG